MSNERKSGGFWKILVTLIILGGAGFAGWHFFLREKPGVPIDREAAIATNNRGVGRIERFEYETAAEEFELASKQNPDWIVPKINLAIAVLNLKKEEGQEQVETLLGNVLKQDPNNAHAHFTLGMLYLYLGRLNEAYPHFEAVSKIDSKDAHTWYHLARTTPAGEDSDEAFAFLEKALQCNPYLNVARYVLMQHVKMRDPVRRRALSEEWNALSRNYWETEYKKIRYVDMGPYAEVIGRTAESHPPQPVGPLPTFEPWEQFSVALAPGTRWATAADLGQGAVGDLLRAVRERFGATMVFFDFDKDGKTDILLLAAIVQDGKLRDLLLRNEGGGKFTDVTTAAGLGGSSVSLGCAVADFDDDDFRDLVITGVGTQRLLRNTGKGAFEDVSAKAGLDKIGGVCLGAAWCDIDQDSDLDLLLTRLADSPEGALDALRGKPAPGGRLMLLLNTGGATPVAVGFRHPPLTVSFRPATEQKDLLLEGPVTGLGFADLDDDKDVDFVVLRDGKPPAAVRNDRLLRFRPIAGFPGASTAYNGVAFLDINHDGRSDVVLLPNGSPPNIYLTKPGRAAASASDWYTVGITNSPPLKHARAVDIDADGWTDMVGLSAEGKPVLLHNDGLGALRVVPDAFGLKIPADLVAVAVTDLDGDGRGDAVLWSETGGLSVRRAMDNGNKTLRMELTGRYETVDTTRSNVDGIGCKVTVQTGRFWSYVENATLAAGLGQSRLPIEIGIGRADSAEAVRILWPDGIPQAELDWKASEFHAQHEINRKPTSCPVLLVWDGSRYRYVTDFLGAGSMGESNPDGSVRPPRPEESVKIEPGMMVPKDGKLLVRIAEPMDEVMYLDRLQLLAIDHPKGTQVHPDERFVFAESQPSQDILAFKESIFPVKAVDHGGRDVTALLRERDKKYVDQFDLRSWLGYAEDHFVELDFGDRLAKSKPGQRQFLVLAGWTDYAYPESIWAATQAGVETIAPQLERQGPDGKWLSLGDLGLPAGLPRVMTKEVTGLLDGPTCKIRLRSNMRVYWDQIFVAPLDEVAVPGGKGTVRVTPVEMSSATLAARGFIQEIRPQHRGPIEYDGSRTEMVAVTPWKGMMTKLGDVTDLLQARDDRFVVSGPGDEVTVAFDATKLPTLPDGWERSYVLRTWGYSKDTSPTTVTGGHVEPLPFKAMKNYPPTAEELKTIEPMQADYRRKWNTRPGAGGPG